METVPPSHAPQRKNSTTLIVVLIVAALLGMCLFVVLGAFWLFSGIKRTVFPAVGCVLSFEMARKAALKYADEHGVLPNAESWQDDVTPYLDKNLKDIERTPFDFKPIRPGELWGCVVGEGKMTGMAFNSELSGKKLSEVGSQYSTVLIFEIEAPRMNAHEPYVERDFSKSPTIMGEKRGWIIAPLFGEATFDVPEGKESAF